MHARRGFRGLFFCPTHTLLDVCVPPASLHPSSTSNRSFGPNHLRAVWRLSLGFGVFPALAVLIWRINMEEPERFKRDSMRDTRIPYWLIVKRYWVGLAAISLSWFVYDFITYPVRLLSPCPCPAWSLISFLVRVVLYHRCKQCHWRKHLPFGCLRLGYRHQVSMAPIPVILPRSPSPRTALSISPEPSVVHSSLMLLGRKRP